MKSIRTLSITTIIVSLLVLSCSGDQERESPEPEQLVDAKTASEPAAPPPRADRHYVLDEVTRTIYEIDLEKDEISNRFEAKDNLVCIAYDPVKRMLYQGFGAPDPALKLLNPATAEVVQAFEFPEPVTAMLFHPIKRCLYIISKDSTHFMTFDCDSLKMVESFPLHVVNRGFVGPISLSPGPGSRLITANGDRTSFSAIYPDAGYQMQTITNSLADRIDCAVFAFDGTAAYSCDTKKGSLFRIQFGSGEIQTQLDSLDRPRSVQIEVNSNTVVVVVGRNDVLMLHPDTFTETGRISLADHGDRIVHLEIPPKANFAEVLMTYKGVTRWLRFDIRNWEVMRLVELI